MRRRPNTEDVTWFLDLYEREQLDLSPPYQRKSVWTLKDKRFFLDTVFRNYPCPPIFLHKSVDEFGKSTYHVVDGKQRLQAIISFVKDEFTLSPDFGDTNLDGKQWRDISTDYRKKLWDYVLAVDYIDDVSGTTVNDIFDRVNRNQIKLGKQELRHAKYSGWFITEAEREAETEDWAPYGISSTANVRRMRDVQFISELMLVVIENDIRGFSQDALDAKYAEYDDPFSNGSEFTEKEFLSSMQTSKSILRDLEQANHAVSIYAKNFTHLYTLWSMIVIDREGLGKLSDLASKYKDFMEKVRAALPEDSTTNDENVATYVANSRGASTDLKQRKARLEALRMAVLPH